MYSDKYKDCRVVKSYRSPPILRDKDDHYGYTPEEDIEPFPEYDVNTVYLGKPQTFLIQAEDLDEQIRRESGDDRIDEDDYLEIDPEKLIAEEEEFELVNEFEVPEELVEDVESGSNELAEKLRDLILLRTAKLHMAFDVASAQVEAIMRDRFMVETEVDPEPLMMINCIGDLELLNEFLKHSDLPESVRDSTMAQFTEKIVTSTHASMVSARTNKIKSARFRAELDNYKSKLGKGENETTTNSIGSVALNSKPKR